MPTKYYCKLSKGRIWKVLSEWKGGKAPLCPHSWIWVMACKQIFALIVILCYIPCMLFVISWDNLMILGNHDIGKWDNLYFSYFHHWRNVVISMADVSKYCLWSFNPTIYIYSINNLWILLQLHEKYSPCINSIYFAVSTAPSTLSDSKCHNFLHTLHYTKRNHTI